MYKEIKPSKPYVVFTRFYTGECDNLHQAKEILELNYGGRVYKKESVFWYNENGNYSRTHDSPILTAAFDGKDSFQYSNGRRHLYGWEVEKHRLEESVKY